VVPHIGRFGGRLAIAVADCWFDGNYTAAASAGADELDEMAERLDRLGAREEAAKGDHAALARMGYALCSNELEARRSWPFIALGLGIALAIVVFAAGGRPRPEEHPLSL
jgi:hypothetical protein